ncbi:response regulator [Falsiroseomonas sp. E2-1-a20]|uniref:response regulator n=1 Tax=Falsiroseomonas sp. E2-1-a20 TaxID=3239300 RepID=UPI003F353C87
MAGAGYGEADAGVEVLRDRTVPTAAIAALEGSLAALEALFGSLPPNTGLALVVLVRDADLRPLEDLLVRLDKLPFVRAIRDMPLLPDRVHVMAAGSALRIRQGRLAAAAAAPHNPLDVLFDSLAESEGSRAIAVVLSGSGTDGARGLAEVRRQGGRVLVHDRAEAEATEQLRRTLAGVQVLPVAALGAALARHAAMVRDAELGDPVLQAIRQPIALLESGGRVVRANAAFHEVFGTATPGADMPLAEALRAAPRLAAFLATPDASADGAEEAIVEVGRPGDGADRRLLRLSARSLSRSPPQTLLVVEDITEATRLAARLELAKAVAERADRDKSRFLAAASHDLRQPLQSMSMLHGLLAAKAGDPAMLRLIGRLDETIDTMSGILDTLLDLNQMEVGRTQASIAPVALGPLLTGLQRDFAEAARGAGLAWRSVPTQAMVLSDARLLRQILRNLLGNALKYTRMGRILLGCRRVGGMLRIEVWDTGIGIPRAQLPAVFEEAQQVSGTARARGQGIGLGLAIARRLADLLGHPIGVRSREGVGSCFHVDVPLAASPEATAPPSRTPRHPAIGSTRILVIEDDAAVAEGLRMLLQQAGHAVVLAHEGSQAIAVAVEHPPALVVADFNLPGTFNGVEVVLQLRQVLPDPPAAIILSGDTSAQTRQEIGLPGVEYAPKPVRAEDLLERIRHLLPQRPTQATVLLEPAAPEPGPAEVVGAQPRAEDRPGMAEEQAESATAVGHVFIVDDDAALRRDVAEWLEANGWTAEVFGSAEAFLQADDPSRQGCVLVDAVMPGMDGLELLAALRPHAQRLPAIMVTGHGDVRMAVRAMAAGAMDFIEKPIRRHDLLRSICNANARITNAMGEAAVRAEVAARLARLTPRQREILDRVIAGSPSKIIAAELKLNQRTVENHRAAIMSKLNARSLPELIRKVVSAGNPPSEG